MKKTTHDFDWSKAPAPWGDIGPKFAMTMKRIADEHFSSIPRPLKIGPLPEPKVNGWRSV